MLKKQHWINLLVGKKNEFLHNNSWFLAFALKMDSFVENEYINFAHKGSIPGVTKNPTYPLTKITREDIPDRIPLAPYSTDQFVLPRIDMHAVPYDQRATILEDHRAALIDEIVSEGIWNVSPYEDTARTPLIEATGAVVNGHKLITGKDIIELRKKINKAYPALKTHRWGMAMDSDSYYALIDSDPIIQMQMAQKGRIGDVNVTKGINYHGFEIYEDNRTPWYDASNRQRMPYGSSGVIGTDLPSATVFAYRKTFAKAIGKTKFFDDRDDSSYQADMGSFLTHAYVGPLSEDMQTNLIFMGGILRVT